MLVIQQSRLKLAVVTALSGALTVVLAFLTFVSAYLPDLWSYLGVSLFAPVGIACGVVALWNALALVRPGTLSADARGITHRSWRSERAIAWEDVERFIVFSPTSKLRSPGCELKSGRFVSFGRNWEKTAEVVVEVLNENK
jgi:hypothetical protein